MSCKECEYSPKTYEEYCIGQRNPSTYCPDAYTEKSHLCGNYGKEDTPLCDNSGWIPVSEGLPKVNEEAYSNDVLVSLRKTIWDTYKCQMVHITKIAYYDKSAISSNDIYMDTEGWVLDDGSTLSMGEVIAWMALPEPYKEEREDE